MSLVKHTTLQQRYTMYSVTHYLIPNLFRDLNGIDIKVIKFYFLLEMAT